MAQSRRQSVIEVTASVLIGLVVSMIANHFVFPRYGFVPSLSSNVQITVIYTVISLVRSYLTRRLFNFLHG